VSFGTYARKVRDHTLPHGRRVGALVSCVQMYQPIGFRATFSYLEHVAGPLRRNEAALLRAMDALSASRAIWLKQLAAYAEQRREAKRLGRRNPRPADSNPNSPACWYGDARAAAQFALRSLLNRPAEVAMVDPEVIRLACACLAAQGDLDKAERERLSGLRLAFSHGQKVAGRPDIDWPVWQTATASLRVLRHIEYACACGVDNALS
jgi:hypothetical protein